MSTAQLSTEQAPPISVPFRFFALAPLFLTLAALILANGGDFNDIHTPVMLAALHGITLGFMALVMLGAIQQILPVVIGSTMPATRLVAWFSFLPVTLGTLSLCGGLLLGEPRFLNLAAWLLGAGFLTFIVAAMISLQRAAARNTTRTALFLSVLALTGAMALGMLLAHGHASGETLDYGGLAALHMGLGLGGWVMLLIAGVSFQVVPMFQLTPNYPQWMSAGLTQAIFAALLLYVSGYLLKAWPLARIGEGLFWLLSGSFAVVTLRLQHKRRRRVADATLSFFRLGMASLLCAAAFRLTSWWVADSEWLTTLAVLTFVLGFALSVIHGMLYKIVPFLVWFHLFRGGVTKGVPNMKEIIPESWMWRHWWLHLCTLLAVGLAMFWNTAFWLAIFGLAAQGLLLGAGIYTGITVYRRILARQEVAAP
ncbi:MAG: hypothetical protein PHH47_06165 [Gallionella sp.]|nr:hypothetical protein [Gallionella sp.]MDD4946010.1 hypothetical protein [Gallionella sp.]